MVRIVILIFGVVAVLFSCKSPGGIITTGNSEQVIIKEKLKDTTLPADRVANTLDSSWLSFLNFSLKKNKRDTFYSYSNTGQTVLKYYLNDTGTLTAQCEAMERYLQYLEKEILRVSNTHSVELKEVKVTPWWMYLIIGVLLGFIVILLLKKYS